MDRRSYNRTAGISAYGGKAYACHPSHDWREDSPSQEHWNCGTETNKASNGEVVRLRTGRLTPATFSEAAETLTVSVVTRTQNWIENEIKNSQHGVAPHDD